MTTQSIKADQFGAHTKVIDAQAFDNIQIIVDRDAALLAGYDHHGTHIVEVLPSELTERQRKTLLAINYRLTNQNTGSKINGTETLVELLERAADKIDADKAKEQQRIDEAVETITRKILENSPYNPHHIDEKTGVVEFEENKHALIQIDALKAFKKWHDSYFFRCVGDNYFVGEEKTVNAIRERVLSNQDVAERLASLEKVADHIQAQLDKAKETRDRIAQERKTERERIEAEQQQAKRDYRTEFVINHMHETARKRFEAGLMPDSEIDMTIEAAAIAPLDGKFHWIVSPDSEVDDDTVFEHVRLSLNDDDEYVSGPVRHIIRPLSACDDDEYLAIERMKKTLDAEYKPVAINYYPDSHTGENDPEYEIVAVEVTVTAGPFQFTRLYQIDDQTTVDGAEG